MMSQGLEQRLSQALQQLQKGQLESAAMGLEGLVSEGLDSVDGLRILGSIRRRQERHIEAASWLGKALKKAPADIGLAEELLAEMLRAEDYHGALSMAERVTSGGHATVLGWTLLAHARRSMGRLELASQALDRAMEIDPGSAGVHYERGMLCTYEGRLGAAIEAFQRATELDPSLALAWVQLGATMAGQRGQVVGMAHIQKALKLSPRSSLVRLRAAMAFVQRGNLELAEKCLAQIFRRHPEHEEALSCLANIHELRGEYGKALETARPVLKGRLTRTNVAVSFARSCLRQGRAQEGLEVLDLALSVGRPDSGIRLLEHIRGACLAKLGRHEEALAAYTNANAKGTQEFNPSHFSSEVDQIIEAFPAESFARRPKARYRAESTILIVGMPRSGTSLVEQILASHSRVIGLGELAELQMTSLVMQKLLDIKPWYRAMDALSVDNLHSLGQWYQSRTRQRIIGLGQEPDGLLGVVDKLPGNYIFLGLCAHILPGLRIIHTRRNPMDTCLSCFAQAFTGGGLGFANRLDWLGGYYREYERMMAHWKDVLPEPIFDVQYEDLVTDPEPIAKGLLAHCGLDWEPGVLEFHRSQRNINTASYHQVRKPIYTSSVNKYEPYLPWLGELVEALEGE
jgi:tetratricopeptide (TPR) repeat protein